QYEFHLKQERSPTVRPSRRNSPLPKGRPLFGKFQSHLEQGGSRQERPSRWNSTLPGEAVLWGSSSSISNKEGSRQARPSRWNSTLPKGKPGNLGLILPQTPNLPLISQSKTEIGRASW